MMPSPLAIDFQPLCAFLATQDEVVAAYLFGSVAQGRAHPGSCAFSTFPNNFRLKSARPRPAPTKWPRACSALATR